MLRPTTIPRSRAGISFTSPPLRGRALFCVFSPEQNVNTLQPGAALQPSAAKKAVQPYFWCSQFIQLLIRLIIQLIIRWHQCMGAAIHLEWNTCLLRGIVVVFSYIYFFRLPTIGGGEHPRANNCIPSNKYMPSH